MAIFQLNNNQADTMLRVTNGRIPIIAVIGASYEDERETATKLGEYAQDVADLVGLGLLKVWESEKAKDIALEMSNESSRSVDIYTYTDIGKLMFRNTGDRLLN